MLSTDDHCHQEYMKVATDFISAVSTDTLDGPQERESGILSDSGLAFLASHLGHNWSILMLRLGLLQSKVEQLQMNYPSVSYWIHVSRTSPVARLQKFFKFVL